MTYTLKKDGIVILVSNNDFDIVKYLHKAHSYSVHYATTYGGYTVEDENGNILKY